MKLVFDLDGTLINSLPSIELALNLALTELNRPNVDQAQVKTWIGNGSDVLVARGLSQSFHIDKSLDEQLIKEAHFLFNQAYEANGHDMDDIYPGVANTLAEFNAAGIEMAVLTNKTARFVEPILAKFNIHQYFKYLVGGDSLAEKKPSPIGLLHLAEQFSVKLEDLWMVGDSRNDILAAKNAGVNSIGVNYGYNYGESIDLSQPDYSVEQFAQIKQLSPIKARLNQVLV